MAANPVSDMVMPKKVKRLDISQCSFYKLHKVVSEELVYMEALLMSNMQLTEVLIPAGHILPKHLLSTC